MKHESQKVSGLTDEDIAQECTASDLEDNIVSAYHLAYFMSPTGAREGVAFALASILDNLELDADPFEFLDGIKACALEMCDRIRPKE